MQPSPQASRRGAVEIALALCVLVLFAAALGLAAQLAPGARELPLLVAGSGCLLAVVQAIAAIRGQSLPEELSHPIRVRRSLSLLAGLGGLVLLTDWIGFVPSAAILTLWVCVWMARMHPGLAVAYTSAVVVAVHRLAALFSLHLPTGRLGL